VKGGLEIDTAAFAGRKTPEREKHQRGEIDDIIIARDFIGIIITIILIPSTFIFTITMPSRYNILSLILSNS
jgi:hypothetical protein